MIEAVAIQREGLLRSTYWEAILRLMSLLAEEEKVPRVEVVFLHFRCYSTCIELGIWRVNRRCTYRNERLLTGPSSSSLFSSLDLIKLRVFSFHRSASALY
jgi:hypothetical protein